MRKLTSTVAVLLLLTGCILNNWTTGYPAGYPKEWPPLTAQRGNCPDITGTFRDLGFLGYEDPKYPDAYASAVITGYTLAWRFFQEPTMSKERKVQISHPDTDSFIVEVLEQDKLVSSGTFSISSGDVACEEGWVRLKPKVEGGLADVGVYRNKTYIGLAKAVDGSLVSKEDTSGFGAVMFIIPLVSSQTVWYRWRPIR
jgi:hypothetical protein